MYLSILALIVFILVLFLFFLVERNTAKLTLGLITALIAFSTIVCVYSISIFMGRDGFSIFAAQELVDDQLYFYSAQYIADQLLSGQSFDLDAIYDMQIARFEYSSSKSVFFAMFGVPLYVIFPDSGPLPFILLNILFCMLIINLLLSDILKTRGRMIFNFGQSNNFISGFSILTVSFMLFCFLYPNFMIRLVQIEKDMMLAFLFIAGFMQLKRCYVDGLGRIGVISFSVILGLLFVLRPQFSIVLFLALIYSKYFITENRYKFRIYLVSCLALFPLSVVFLEYLSPEIFDLLVRMKKFSVMAGVTDFLHVDYSSYLSILKTLLVSCYYFFLAPISVHTLQGNIMWIMMMIEPIVFFLIPVCLSLKWYKYMPDGRKLFYTLLLVTLAFALFSTVFESHVGGYLRKRIPIYLLWGYFMFNGFCCYRYRLYVARPNVKCKMNQKR